MPKGRDFATTTRAAQRLLPDVDAELVILYIALTRLGREIDQNKLEILQADHIGPSEHRVLLTLWLHGPDEPLSHAEISRFIVQTPSGTTKTLNRLEAAGLIQRDPNPNDARAQLVHLTPHGTTTVARHFRERLNHWNARLSPYTSTSGHPIPELLWQLANNESDPHDPTRLHTQ